MPRLWTDTIATHRRGVQDAVIGAAWQLMSERGLRGTTMSQIAEASGIGRATLYKYFSDVETILRTGHERHVERHLDQLVAMRDKQNDPGSRLDAVISAYATISFHRGQHGTPELSALMHQGQDVVKAERRLTDLFRGCLADAAAAGVIRSDVKPAELAAYCVHALAAAGSVGSEAAARRLADVTMTGLRRPLP